MKHPELLLPAGSLPVLKTAVLYGADAVYIGGEVMSLRAKAKNFTENEMREGIAFAHQHGKKVYVTANIYAHNADLKEAVERYTDIDLWSETVREKLPEPLSAGRTPKVDGKGKNKYYEIMNAHLPITGSSNSQSVKLFKRIIY